MNITIYGMLSHNLEPIFDIIGLGYIIINVLKNTKMNFPGLASKCSIPDRISQIRIFFNVDFFKVVLIITHFRKKALVKIRTFIHHIRTDFHQTPQYCKYLSKITLSFGTAHQLIILN